jgi:hypothetical protein
MNTKRHKAAKLITDSQRRAFAQLVTLFATPKLSQDAIDARCSRILGRIPSADAVLEAATRVDEHLGAWMKEFAA